MMGIPPHYRKESGNGFISAILEKLGFSQREERSSKPAPATAPTPAAQEVPVQTPRVVAISQVDVVAKLESLAASNPQKLNWKTSIVDLLKLLGLDSSLEARKGLRPNSDAPRRRWAILRRLIYGCIRPSFRSSQRMEATSQRSFSDSSQTETSR
jgi:Domain of unknown function (DUF3597)